MNVVKSLARDKKTSLKHSELRKRHCFSRAFHERDWRRTNAFHSFVHNHSNFHIVLLLSILCFSFLHFSFSLTSLLQGNSFFPYILPFFLFSFLPYSFLTYVPSFFPSFLPLFLYYFFPYCISFFLAFSLTSCLQGSSLFPYIFISYCIFFISSCINILLLSFLLSISFPPCLILSTHHPSFHASFLFLPFFHLSFLTSLLS